MADSTLTLFLAGDVMTGRGIDQILPTPSAPQLFEPWVKSARDYVTLAEERNGPIPRKADFAYVWGAGLEELSRRQPAVRIINLETAVTGSADAWPGKGIHYRMHPANAAVLSVAGIDCCSLANNHVMDWGYAGLAESLEVLRRRGIRSAGAGADLAGAATPAVIEAGPGRRVLVFAFCTQDSGVLPEFGATGTRAGVNLLRDLSARTCSAIARDVQASRREGDIVVASIHWGGNWGYGIANEQRRFAHRLIDDAHVDLVHGHSSHHAKGIEVHHGKLILYGCGDFVNDYEGIEGHEQYRADLPLMFFPTLDTRGRLAGLTLVPLRMRRFRLEPADADERQWLLAMLNREGEDLGSRFYLDNEGRLVWDASARPEGGEV